MKEKIISRLEKYAKEDVERHLEYTRSVIRAFNVAKNILEMLPDELLEDTTVSVEGIGERIYFYTENRRLVHELCKLLNVSFTKDFNEHFGEVAYYGKFGTTTISIMGIKNVPKCRIIRKKVVEEREVYEIQCH